jgi:nuclear transport factor 2 (NTF2) superfamily protein
VEYADPARVVLAYTSDSRWRNRAEFLEGRDAIKAFLTRKWQRELDYRLIKEVWAFRENCIAVRFAYDGFGFSRPTFTGTGGNDRGAPIVFSNGSRSGGSFKR